MKKILLVDADLKARLALQEILEDRREWRVVKAGSGGEALAGLRALEIPDLAIFGQETGDGTGADLLKQLRAEEARALRILPVLLAVPAAEVAATAEATGLDAAMILGQPFDAARVAAAVERFAG